MAATATETRHPKPLVDMGELSTYAGEYRLQGAKVDGDRVQVTWDDGYAAGYHPLWLRDHCPCSACRHPQTRERTFRLLDLPEALPQPAVEASARGTLVVRWPAMAEHAAHESEFDPGWLRQRATADGDIDDTGRTQLWDAGIAADPPAVDFGEVTGSDAGLRRWLGQLDRYGFALIDNGPTEPGSIEAVVSRIGWPRETNFGRYFDVVSKPNPNNAAFTAIALEPHIDLPNWERPPDFQFLYCLENEAEGGASTLVDGFEIAESLRSEDPEAFRTLSEQPVDFRFQDEEADIAYRAPVIGLDATGQPAEIRFNNWIRDTLRLPSGQVEAFYRAYRQFWERLRDPRFVFRFTLKPGQMMGFDNLRVLHGREAFDPNTGQRHLQGTYIDRDLVRSRLRVLERGY